MLKCNVSRSKNYFKSIETLAGSFQPKTPGRSRSNFITQAILLAEMF